MIPSAREVALLVGIVLALAVVAWLTGQVVVIALAPLAVVASTVVSALLRRPPPADR